MTRTVAGDPMTTRQARVFDFIVAFIKERGMSPTYREIQAGLGFASPTAVMDHLTALKNKGRINWLSHSPRTIRVASGKTCSCCGGVGRVFDDGGTVA